MSCAASDVTVLMTRGRLVEKYFKRCNMVTTRMDLIFDDPFQIVAYRDVVLCGGSA